MTFTCCDPLRRNATAAHATLNGLDYLEVLDRDLPDTHEFRQRTLDIRDQLLAQLEKGGSLEVKLALVAWVEARKADLKAYIHRPNLDHYYRPR